MSDTFKHISFHTKYLASHKNDKVNNQRQKSLPIRSAKQIPILNTNMRNQNSNASHSSIRSNDKFNKNQTNSSYLLNSNLSYVPIPSLNTTRISFNQVDWNSLIDSKIKRNEPKKGQNRIILEKLCKKSTKAAPKKNSFLKPNLPKNSDLYVNGINKDSELNKWGMIHKAYSTVTDKSNYNIFFEKKEAMAKEPIQSIKSSKLQSENSSTLADCDFRRISEVDEKLSQYQISNNENKQIVQSDLGPIFNKSTNFFPNKKKDFWARINITSPTTEKSSSSIQNDVIEKDSDTTVIKQFTEGIKSTREAEKLIISPKATGKTISDETKPPDMDEIFQRILDRNKKEAEARNNGLFLNSAQFHQRICSKRSTSHKFYNATNNKFFTKTENEACIDKKGNLELYLDTNDVEHWRRHEQTWSSVLDTEIIDSNIKFLVPPNEKDILLSSYYFAHNCSNSRITINCSKPEEEVKKWKVLYKKLMVRWHPDKMYPLLEKLNLEEDMVNKIKRKTFSIIDNLSNYFAYIIKKIKSMA